MTTTPEWREAYKAALLETDWSNMHERIQTAEAAIQARQCEFNLDHGGTPEENHAIADALRSLNILREEVTSWLLTKKKDAV